MFKLIHPKVLYSSNLSSYAPLSKLNDSLSSHLLHKQGEWTILNGSITPTQGHPYHLVDLSPWPLQTSIVLGTFVSSFVLTFTGAQGASTLYWFCLISLILHMSLWFSDVVAEGTLNGDHTSVVMKGLVLGMTLFIVTELVFFIFIFWVYLHSSLSPVVELGCDWPPLGIDPLDAKAVPTLNTALLLSSGAAVTWSHHALLGGNRKGAILGLIFTVILAAIFTLLQGFEYVTATFTFADSVYGNTFFFGTGCHGLHVIVGSIMLTVAGVRLVSYHFSNTHHIGYEAAILYWHFVDIVWLVLYVVFYWWGS
jgi:cytochrome c oxidase subunit 3